MRRLLISSLALTGSLWGCGSPAPPAAPRSIVLITVDTLRADRTHARIAPTLDRLARESVRFETAVTVSPVTLPAHASLLTGLYPTAHGVRDNQIFTLAASTPTLTSWLKGRGYATAAFVSAIVLDSRYGLNAGFDLYDDEIGGATERRASDTLERARQWLQQTRPAGGSGPPFFVWVHLFEPHAPYTAGSYDAEVTAVDQALATFFDAMKQQGLWDDVVLSVTSDHGESLGEHGESTHGFFVYDSTVRIPWLLKSPGQTPSVFAPQVRIVDVLPTMIALATAGTAQPWQAAKEDGIDLTPYLRGQQSPRLEAYVETFLPRHQFNWSELRALRTERAKYVAAPEPELFDLTEDPEESRNLVADRREAAASLASTLAALERRTSPATSRPASDAVLAEKFMSLGYIGYSPAARSGTLPDPKRKLQVYELTMSAYELAGRGKTADALAALRRAAAADPEVTQVHYLEGTILGQQERYAEAAAALEQAVRLNPRFVTAQFKLALAYLRLKDTARAERALRTVIEYEPENVRGYHNLAAIAYSRGDLAAAETLERRALAIDDKYFDAWNTLGAIHLLSKRTPEAIQALETAIRLNPASGQAHYNLALALRAAGRAPAADEMLRKACSLDRRYCP